MKNILLIACLLVPSPVFSQTAYEDSIKSFQKNYVETHEVVKEKDREQMHFFKATKTYRIAANFKPSTAAEWISFKTSGTKNKVFRLYGVLSFTLNKKACRLNVYQSQELMMNEHYKNYLFLPFTDLTTGKETYASGRYIDLTTDNIKNNKANLDFNKAYNPYCAYVSGVYNCPIPPKENALPVEVKAGEKIFTASH